MRIGVSPRLENQNGCRRADDRSPMRGPVGKPDGGMIDSEKSAKQER
jgi:hypothetical protein